MEAGISKSMSPLSLGLTVITKLLADHAFLPPHSRTDVHGVSFPAPEGDALQKPVCDAICSLVDHPVSAEAVQRCLYMSAESVTGTDDEEEEDEEEEKEKEENHDSDECDRGAAVVEEEGAGGKSGDDRATSTRSTSGAPDSKDGGNDDSKPAKIDNDAGSAVCEMETVPRSEDARNTVRYYVKFGVDLCFFLSATWVIGGKNVNITSLELRPHLEEG